MQRRILLLLSVACVAIAVLAAQTRGDPDWQTAAGGKMAFEVASVKPSKVFRPPNYPLDHGNAKTPGGRFSAGMRLATYISFAYKLGANPEQTRIFMRLPESVSKDFYEIAAQAPGNPTKDQVRLMMQSLLEERFKLAVHFGTREVSVLALTLVKPGETGPKLRPHAEGPPCSESVTKDIDPRTSSNVGQVFPQRCEITQMRLTPDGMRLVGSRNTTLPLLADEIYATGALGGEVDKPVVDKTGLSGRFDFTIEYMPNENDLLVRSRPGADNPPLDFGGTPFLRAVREQLGLKLTPSRGQVRILIVDHVEPPSEN